MHSLPLFWRDLSKFKAATRETPPKTLPSKVGIKNLPLQSFKVATPFTTAYKASADPAIA